METISLTSAVVDCHMTEHNWQQFQAEGHSITVRMPKNPNCPACNENRVHQDADRQYHAQDKVYCLNLFTIGTNPDDWKNTGIQCIRVQAASREEAIQLMQEAIIDTVYAFGRQEYSKQFAQSELDKLNQERNQFHLFMTAHFPIPDGETPITTAVRLLRAGLKAQGKDVSKTDLNELLPQSWRRD